MDRLLRIEIAGRHASIDNLVWDGVPPFSVITGLNGAGKSQLLEVLAHPYVAERPGSRIAARVIFRDEQFARGEVFHSYGEWAPLTSQASSEDQIRHAIHRLQADRRNEALLTSLAANLGMNSETIRLLTPPQFIRILTPGILWTYSDDQSLSSLFLAYRYFERAGLESGEALETVRTRLGEAPWHLMSSIIRAAGLPFSINYPAELPISRFKTNEEFEFQLRDSEGLLVPMEQLSSGERVLMATATWRYQAQVAGRYYRLLLLDEPDAHLHPSLTRRFLNVIREVFVEQRHVRVIMTTHSPSTVALTPDGCLFEMRRSQPRLRAITRTAAVASLTGGFVAVQDATRTVLLEGKDDPPFYRQIWQMLVEPSLAGQAGVLKPYPNINFVRGQGRETVLQLVTQLRIAGFTNFYGVIDRDEGNSASDFIFVLSRRAIENYLYDPLNVWMCINRMARTKENGLYAPNIEVISLGERPPLELQSIVDSVVRRVERVYPRRSAIDAERVAVEYPKGLALLYPRWCLTQKKSSIKIEFHSVFPCLSARDLLATYVATNMVPIDLVQLLGTIQGSVSSGREGEAGIVDRLDE